MAFPALIDETGRLPTAPFAPPPSFVVRLRALVQRVELTRRLAEGADSGASRELALRAREITRPCEIRECVNGLERVLREAAMPSRGLTAQAPLQRDAILAARPFLLSLLDALREVQHPRAAGVAHVEMLLTDGTGPIYAPSYPGTLASAAYRARDAL
jgi:hypothetical protein